MRNGVWDWFSQNAYGRFTYRVLLAIGSAVVTIALSFLPYDTILQAIWVVISSLYVGYFVLQQRLNETDDVRYRRLFKSRFAYLEKTDPEALTTVFAENVRPSVMDWFEQEYHVPIKQVKAIDALDSLARSGDKPGQLIFRLGVELGHWLHRNESKEEALSHLEQELEEFILDNKSLLGEEVAPGVFRRMIKVGERRPVGVHMFHPDSQILYSLERYEGIGERYSIALSLKSSLFAEMSDEEWEVYKQRLLDDFPYFKPLNGGSGPQRRQIPLFVCSNFRNWPVEQSVINDKLKRLLALTIPQPEPKATSDSEDVPESQK